MIGSAVLMLVALGALIALGVQVAVALGTVSLAALYFATGDWQVVSRFVAIAAYDGLRNEALLAIPLLTLMGLFILRSGAVTDVFWALTRALRSMPRAVPLAAVIGNALHAFAAGTSTASLASFARITYPELRRRGYDRAFALGALASGSALGMLLPPGPLMVAWGILGQQSAGAIFLAALTPSLVIAVCLCVSVVSVTRRTQAPHTGKMSARPAQALGSVFGLTLIFAVMLGGIASRILSPAEASGVGAVIALLMALRKGMRIGGIVEAVLMAVRAAGPVLLLLFAALLYAQALAVTGAGAAVQASLGNLNPVLGLGIMALVWLVLATMLNAMSVLSVTVVLFVPVATRLGLDPLSFAVIGIIVVEAAQLVPPLGLLVYAAKAAAGDDVVAVFDIFRYVMPLLTILLAAIVIIAAWPELVVWLPRIAR